MIRDSGSVKLYWALGSGLAVSDRSPPAAASALARASRTRFASRIRANRLSRRCNSAGSSSPRRSAPYSLSSAASVAAATSCRSEEHTSELQSHSDLVCRLLLEKKKKNKRKEKQ